MLDKWDGPWGIAASLLLFPMFFQGAVIGWCWGSGDESMLIVSAKRIFLLLPACGVIAGCWISIPCLFSVIVRQNRNKFLNSLLVTWWDLGRAIFAYWGGFLRLVMFLLGWLLAFLRLAILGLWLAAQDIILTPLRAVKGMGSLASRPGVPWIAVWLTILWSVIEAIIFTFVMTNLVIDTLSGVTGVELDPGSVQIFLFFTLLGFILGSYAIVSTLTTAVANRDFKQVALVVVVEILAMAVEVLFLYREFVDALVPWFAQYAGEDFQLGAFFTITIASVVWAGTRAMTWFLFAAAGTPTIMAIIQRTGLEMEDKGPTGKTKVEHFAFVRDALNKIKEDMDWVNQKGDEAISAVILPPLQIVAAVINFFTMLFSARHLFELPFKSYKDMLHADQLIRKAKND